MIVAWHEVPGRQAKWTRPVGNGIIRRPQDDDPFIVVNGIPSEMFALFSMTPFDNEHSMGNRLSSYRIATGRWPWTDSTQTFHAGLRSLSPSGTKA
jgi:hypothetical protein